jgi:hypothetical protein
VGPARCCLRFAAVAGEREPKANGSVWHFVLSTRGGGATVLRRGPKPAQPDAESPVARMIVGFAAMTATFASAQTAVTMEDTSQTTTLTATATEICNCLVALASAMLSRER